MTRPVTVTVRVPVEVTLVCVVRVTPGHPGTMYARNGDPGDPPEPDEHEVVEASFYSVYGKKEIITSGLPIAAVLSNWDEYVCEAASDAVARGEG